MTLKIVSYKDTKLNVFSHPIMFNGDLSDEDIIETFRRMCSSPDFPKAQFEFDIYVLGSFDDKSGQFTTFSPQYLCSLGDFKHLASDEVKDNVIG